jgi:hypothetical protein
VKSRFVRALAVTTAALALLVPVTAGPALAEPDGNQQVIVRMANELFKLFRIFSDGSVSPEEVASLIEDSVNEVTAAENQVLSHMDAIAAAEHVGNARNAAIEYQNLPEFDDLTVGIWALTVSNQATNAGEMLRRVDDKATVDDLGTAVQTLYPIALVARSTAGITSTGIQPAYREINQEIIRKLAPSCRWFNAEPGIPSIRSYQCQAYDGHVEVCLEIYQNGQYLRGPVNLNAVADAATRHTSRGAAQAILAALDGSATIPPTDPCAQP